MEMFGRRLCQILALMLYWPILLTAMGLRGFTSTICHPVSATAGYAEPLAWSPLASVPTLHQQEFNQLEGEYTSDGCFNVPALSIPIPSNIPFLPTGHITPRTILTTMHMTRVPLGHHLNHIQLLVLTVANHVLKSKELPKAAMHVSPVDVKKDWSNIRAIEQYDGRGRHLELSKKLEITSSAKTRKIKTFEQTYLKHYPPAQSLWSGPSRLSEPSHTGTNAILQQQVGL
ncbi:uncharacterized protein MELLADRAFT_109910 [Melampsora larici-populina 98AG31]|uniref:Uncharacterized protein n=1 Tax=Melampsora larici-populina (strain 98AG31 / pathotype 3-4-7) TaxID=747676 RepID=F4RY18_MELLP|nr:uncharacterized protein MELLADRAFT_109910 [Melampsora larici-populina 98AG31]EGG02607.1 hypothetical protein MELLADRAFT_109910 [Melampsora larici-populina 98AG31]